MVWDIGHVAVICLIAKIFTRWSCWIPFVSVTFWDPDGNLMFPNWSIECQAQNGEQWTKDNNTQTLEGIFGWSFSNLESFSFAIFLDFGPKSKAASQQPKIFLILGQGGHSAYPSKADTKSIDLALFGLCLLRCSKHWSCLLIGYKIWYAFDIQQYMMIYCWTT